jgi:uncharacterized protein (TIGR00725 family)
LRRPIIGLVGAGRFATDEDKRIGHELGLLIAGRGWVLLSGGTKVGVMDASCKAAHEAGGLVVGVIAGKDSSRMSEYVDIPIFTGMGSGRNFINVLSSDVIIACGGMVAGTLSEVALTLREDRPVVLLNGEPDTRALLKRIGGKLVHIVDTPKQAIENVAQLLNLQIPEEINGNREGT